MYQKKLLNTVRNVFWKDTIKALLSINEKQYRSFINNSNLVQLKNDPRDKFQLSSKRFYNSPSTR